MSFLLLFLYMDTFVDLSRPPETIFSRGVAVAESSRDDPVRYCYSMLFETWSDTVPPRAAEPRRRHRNIYALHGLHVASTTLAPSNSSFHPLWLPADPSPLGDDHGSSTGAWQGSVSTADQDLLAVNMSLWLNMHVRLVGLGFFARVLDRPQYGGGVRPSAHSPLKSHSVGPNRTRARGQWTEPSSPEPKRLDRRGASISFNLHST